MISDKRKTNKRAFKLILIAAFLFVFLFSGNQSKASVSRYNVPSVSDVTAEIYSSGQNLIDKVKGFFVNMAKMNEDQQKMADIQDEADSNQSGLLNSLQSRIAQLEDRINNLKIVPSTETIRETVREVVVNNISQESLAGISQAMEDYNSQIANLRAEINRRPTGLIGGTSSVQPVSYSPNEMTFVPGGSINSLSWAGSTITPSYGGTGVTSYNRGDILFATTSSQLATLATGTESQVLKILNGIPAWGDVSGADTNWIASGTTMYATDTIMSLGVGTATPAFTLDVNGTLRVVATSTFGNISGGNWQGTAVGTQYGGTGTSTASWTGIPYIATGTWGTTTESDPLWTASSTNFANWNNAYAMVNASNTQWQTGYNHSLITSGNPHNVTKSDVSLGSVENTAISTWAGSANITTLGTIAAGTWNATVIDTAHGGIGTSTVGWTGNVYLNNGVWGTTTISTLSGGQTNYLPVWTSDTTLGTSTIFQSGLNVSVAGNILPATTTTYDLGNSDYKWGNIYSATATIGTGTVTIGQTGISSSQTLNLSSGQNTFTLTSTSTSFTTTTISGELNVTGSLKEGGVALSSKYISSPSSPATGSVLYWTGSNWDVLAPATSGMALVSQGSGNIPSWQNVSFPGGTTVGDADAQAAALANKSDSEAATILESGIFDTDFMAQIMNSSNLTASKAASIVDNSNLVSSTAASIFDNANLTASKAASVMDNANLTASKAASIIDNSNLSSSTAASIFDNANLTASKAASVMDNANLTASKAASICDSGNIVSAKIKSILDTGSLTSADKIAALLDGDSLTVADAAAHVNSGIYSISTFASAFNSSYLVTSRAASIMNNSNLSTSTSALMIDNANLTASKVASVLKDSNITADKTQSIMKAMANYTKIIDIIVSSASDATISSNTSISTQIALYGNLTVNSSITLTLDTTNNRNVIIAKNVTNDGTIGKTNLSNNAGGGLIIITENFDNNSLVVANSGGAGGSTVAGAIVRMGSDSVGLGGNAGGGGSGNYNGGGGGNCPVGGVGGAGGSVSYTTYTAVTLYQTIRNAAIDYWLQNIGTVKNPTATTSFPNIYGASGGGGAWCSESSFGGTGGSGGGQIFILSNVFDNASGTVMAKGGNGGSGNGPKPNYSGSGGGGGGGIVYGLYRSALTAAGTLDPSGGGGGAAGYYCYAGSPGASGATSTVSVSGADIAENYPINDYAIEAGDLVRIKKPNVFDNLAGILFGEESVSEKYLIEKTDKPYDSEMIGIISTNPAIVLGEQGRDDMRAVGLVGRVPVKVSAKNGLIEAGDYITSSDIPGVAMKATKPGRVIGLALESFSGEGIGWITVFLNPHFAMGSDNSEDGSLESLIGKMQVSLTNTIQAVSNQDFLDKFTSLVKASLEKLGMLVDNGVAKIKRLIAGVAQLDKLQMKDQLTGEMYCSWIENGEWVKIKGECGNDQEAVSTSTETSTEPDVFSDNSQSETQLEEAIIEDSSTSTEESQETIPQETEIIIEDIQDSTITEEVSTTTEDVLMDTEEASTSTESEIIETETEESPQEEVIQPEESPLTSTSSEE